MLVSLLCVQLFKTTLMDTYFYMSTTYYLQVKHEKNM